jgi:hypothetical protein
MNHNDPVPYLYFSGRRDLGPDHVKALIEWGKLVRDGDADAVLADLESDARAEDAREEEDARAYLSQKPIMLNSCKED